MALFLALLVLWPVGITDIFRGINALSFNRFMPSRLLPLLLLGLAGCAGLPEASRELPDPDVVVELTDTPFFPQEKYQCGPAALATLLQATGVDVLPEDLVSKVYLPARQGSLQVEMLAATRTSGRIPYLLEPSLAAVVDELLVGRPVVVLQNLGVSLIPRWHYAVIVGIDGPDQTIVLRSGTEHRRETPFSVFLRTWARGDFWAFTALRPGELPAGVERERYLAAVAALEEVGMSGEAALAWRAAMQRWPDDPIPQFGLGNTLLQLGQAEEAERVYRRLLATKPSLTVARNNLAIALRDQARFDDAMREIDRALDEASDPELIEELLDTRRGIQRSRDESGS